MWNFGSVDGIINPSWGGSTNATAYEISYQMKLGTCYLMYMPRGDSGYIDCVLEFIDGQKLLVNRINTGATASSYGSINHGAGIQGPMHVVCVCSGFPNATKIWFYPQRGSFLFMGLAWTSENRDTHSGSWCHSDNIMGNPSSLSDERIKENVSRLDPSICLDVCNSLEPSLYLQTLDNEPRTGLIAQEVQTVLQNHNLPDTPVLDSKWALVDNQPQELVSMRYERLVPMLLGAVKELTNRVAQLESQLTIK